MKIFLLFVLASALLSEKIPVLIVLNSKDISKSWEIISKIEKIGVRVKHLYPPNVLIGETDDKNYSSLFGLDGILRVCRSYVDPSVIEGYGEIAREGIRIWNSLYVNKVYKSIVAKEIHKTKHDCAGVKFPKDFDKAKRKFKSMQTSGFEPTEFETSLFMIGKIAVGVVLTESTPPFHTGQFNTEDWSTEEINGVHSAVATAMEWWADAEPKAKLTFVYDFYDKVPVGYEHAALYSSENPEEQQKVMDEALGVICNLKGWEYKGIRDFAHKLRKDYKTDWAFLIFPVDNSNGTSSESGGYAYLFGPYFTLITLSAGIFAHETGHIFGALDEYVDEKTLDQAYPASSGYLNVINGNYNGSPTCVMYTGGLHDPCPYTRGQVGWKDSDGDGKLDILDVPPEILSFNYPTDPAYEPFVGTARVNGIPSPLLGITRTINTIYEVKWKVDDGKWEDAKASDGGFDEQFEEFKIYPWAKKRKKSYKLYVKIVDSSYNEYVSEYEVSGIPAGIGSVRCYPNPFNLSVHTKLTIDTQATNTPFKAYIYNLTGELVKEVEDYDIIKGLAFWDGLSSKNNKVAPGIYFIFIDSERGKGKGKIAVIR